jgi:putative redox protein
MECTVSWTGATGTRSGMGFLAETGSGHTLMMDGAPDAAKTGGGQNLAPRPMETVLAGTGGCTAYDVVLILKRGRHDVRGCQVKLTAERAEVDPKVFTRIHMHFTVTGQGPAGQRRWSAPSRCPRALLLGQHHAGQDGRDHHRLRGRSVSTTKPRLMASPILPANRPRPNAPAYQSGLRREVCEPSSCRRVSVQAR